MGNRIVLPTRDSLNERKARKLVSISSSLRKELLHACGYIDPNYKTQIQNKIIDAVEHTLGEYYVAKVAVDKQPRPTHIRHRAKNIADLTSNLIRQLNEADQTTLGKILEAGYSEQKWKVTSIITDRISVLYELLKKMEVASEKVVADNVEKNSRKRERTFAVRYAVNQLESIFSRHHKHPRILKRAATIKKNKRVFISEALRSENISIPSTWHKWLKTSDIGQ